MSVLNNNVKILERPSEMKSSISIRRANLKDLNQIYNVASSVGSSSKDPEQGFLMNDYVSEPLKAKEFFAKKLNELDYFFVACQKDHVVGFLMAYTKYQWLNEEPNWLKDITFRPDFPKEYLSNFIIIDKTAIVAPLTGRGIGSLLYKSLFTDLRRKNIKHIFSETLISPTPNFASLNFRIKQEYELAGIRYESMNEKTYTDLIYHKFVPNI